MGRIGRAKALGEFRALVVGPGQRGRGRERGVALSRSAKLIKWSTDPQNCSCLIYIQRNILNEYETNFS